MSAVMDMSLDDIIKNKKKSGFESSRGRIRPFGPGPTRRFPNRAANRAAPYATAKATWQHNLYADQHVAAAGYPAQGGHAASIEIGTKLYISNLDYGVSNDDIKLAEDLGTLPIWVFNVGFSLNDEIDASSIESYVQGVLDGIEFARGSPTSQLDRLRKLKRLLVGIVLES